ncbi:PAS domain S-box-containing protein/diguanylate cyclase (GGDEF) domain-containing protein [Paenibacillus polysaccharolyticus]|uniref:PAS domain S-box-containing protein/diguanylate cyclase (GGDEF) domain-containing protein n=1 Tax=Paenibacillus polysaccharolyticus TaxID=582692 RepID=A0A1G5L0K7_9BACL|nr:diguanylate cyclase [Paenibacillus polysaccharolyticus]SCZ05961.1 PAS domain S-box-containing protein/diguanylate cyclase (GGDEF) domain-containing protein [Paenibacillus polysaccharolyticus]
MAEPRSRQEMSMLNRTLLPQGTYTNDPIDLNNCDKEPIHIPGFIQPHGVLLAIDPKGTATIVQCSQNTQDHLGIDYSDILGMPLSDLIAEEDVNKLLNNRSNAAVTSDLHYMDLIIEVAGEEKVFSTVLHESEGLLILEIEPYYEKENIESNDFEWISRFFGRIKSTDSRVDASQIAAEQVKEMLGYDRVMIYEFDEQWNGKVIAEAREPELEPFLGHHYPASDIPKQARELYLRNWLRTIVNVDYTPVEIVPTLQPLTGKPLNLSLSVLRSVSPLHIEYLQNMGVGATVTISLIHDNQLWGLITCHHYSARYVPHRVRNLCNFLGAFFSNELFQRQQLDDYQAEINSREAATRIVNIFIGNTSPARVVEELQGEQETILRLMNASGAAICYQDKLLLFGETPTNGQIRELAGWLAGQAEDHSYHTSKLSLEYETAKRYQDVASGVIYVAISPGHHNYMLWFRPEVVQVVEWAGDPAKAVLKTDDGVRLSPRKSFEKWREVVQSTSYPWTTRELSILPLLKSIVRRQTENQLAQAEEHAFQNARILKRNEQRYLQLMDFSPVAFFTLTEGRIIYCNRMAAELFGYESTGSLIGKSFNDFLPDNTRDILRQDFEKLQLDITSLMNNQLYFTTASGMSLLFEITMASVVHAGKPSVMLLLRSRTSQQEQDDYSETTNQLRNYLTTDPLTDMPVQTVFKQQLEEDWNDCLQDNCSLGLLIIDIDDFRSYNTAYGLQGGDLCLQWIGEVLTVVSEQHNALISRQRGGTFMLKIKDTTSAHLMELAEEIRQHVLALHIQRELTGQSGVVTVSVGGAVLLPDENTVASDLIELATQALSQAKDEGKNRTRVV